jgi:hypothetical protein
MLPAPVSTYQQNVHMLPAPVSTYQQIMSTYYQLLYQLVNRSCPHVASSCNNLSTDYVHMLPAPVTTYQQNVHTLPAPVSTYQQIMSTRYQLL